MYDYACADCDERFDVLMRHDAEAPPCPACGSQRTARLLSSFATPNARGGKRGPVATPAWSGGRGGCCGGGACGH
jgi:putative FmdB family regulatory protein